MSSLLADLVVALHLAIVIYVIAGVVLVPIGWLLGWAWIRSLRFRLSHLAIMGYIVFNAVRGGTCILTRWETSLRLAAAQASTLPGQPGPSPMDDENISFVARLLHDLLFVEVPQPVLDKVYIGVGVLVLISLIVAPPRLRARRAEAPRPTPDRSTP